MSEPAKKRKLDPLYIISGPRAMPPESPVVSGPPVPVNKEDLKHLSWWAEDRVGFANDMHLFESLLDLCQKYGYGRVTQASQWLETLNGDRSQLEWFKKMRQQHLMTGPEETISTSPKPKIKERAVTFHTCRLCGEEYESTQPWHCGEPPLLEGEDENSEEDDVE